MDICSALLLGSLCCVMLWDLLVPWWVNILWGLSSHIDLNIHCLTSVLGLRFPNSKNIFCPPHHQDDFPAVFQSWVGLDTILYALKILGVLQVLRALPPFHQENVLYNFLYVLEDFVKIRCMTDQKLQKDRMFSNRVPVTEIRRPAAILKCSPLPPPKLRHSLWTEPLDGQLALSWCTYLKSMSRTFLLGWSGQVIF